MNKNGKDLTLQTEELRHTYGIKPNHAFKVIDDRCFWYGSASTFLGAISFMIVFVLLFTYRENGGFPQEFFPWHKSAFMLAIPVAFALSLRGYLEASMSARRAIEVWLQLPVSEQDMVNLLKIKQVGPNTSAAIARMVETESNLTYRSLLRHADTVQSSLDTDYRIKAPASLEKDKLLALLRQPSS